LALVAIGLLVAFVVIESKTANPLVHLSIFRRARYNGAVLANLIANLVFGSVLFFMALYLQVVEGMSPLQAGLLLLPATVPILLMNPLGTWLGNRFGPRWPTAIGMMFLAAAGLYLIMYIGDTYDTVLPAFILIGIGIGLQITPCAVTAVEDPGEAGEGVVSGVFKASSMIGGALGVALSTAVFQLYARNDIVNTLNVPLQSDIDHLLDALTGTVNVDSVAQLQGPSARAQIAILFDDAVAAAMWPSVIGAVAGIAIAIALLKRRKVTA
jgi:predicted MFS family arabinose efflux permease